jgi:hypothetical protein
MLIMTALIGFAVLTMGRQLFWVVTAGVGFILGITYAAQYYSGQPGWVLMAIGLVTGMLGALLAFAMQRFAGAIAGFLAGWYLMLSLFNYIDIDLGQLNIVIPVLGGAIGALLILVLFDWSLIAISSMAGAAIIVQSFQFSEKILTGLFIILAILGIAIQGILYSQEEHFR